MKAFLMYRDQDFDRDRPLPPNEADLVQDVELDTLLAAMADGDDFLRAVARKAILTGFANDLDTVRYRQDVLRDCLAHPDVIRRLYAISIEPIERRKRHYYLSLGGRFPGSTLSGAVHLLEMLVDVLKTLVDLVRSEGQPFRSEGFRTLFAMLQRELDDDYFRVIARQLADLKFPYGVLVSAGLGPGNRGRNYVPRKLVRGRWDWLKELSGHGSPGYSFRLHPRDEAGARALSELRDRGLAGIAETVAQSADHILSFFAMLRTELAFYVGCLNLADRLRVKEAHICFPVAAGPDRRHLAFKGLVDPTLALTLGSKVVANDLSAEGKLLVMITGANQGGKSTFLRSLGLAQLLMQAGMFVAAETFSANLCDGLFTHYRREEDTSLRSGKFDEELRRMSGIVDQMTETPMILFNESFAATNEREGSEIARQIVTALIERGVKVVFVTHMYALAQRFAGRADAVFLRAEREESGRRTFRIVPGAPMQTSYGIDLYEQVFGPDDIHESQQVGERTEPSHVPVSTS